MGLRRTRNYLKRAPRRRQVLLPVSISLNTPLNAIETLPTFAVEVNYENATLASVTSSSLQVQDRSGNTMPVTLDSASTNGSTIEATFTVTPTAATEDFYLIECPAGAAQNNGNQDSDRVYLGTQEVLEMYPQLVSSTLTTWPAAVDTDCRVFSVSFDWTPTAGDNCAVAKSAHTANASLYTDVPSRAGARQTVTFAVDAGEIRFQEQEHDGTSRFYLAPQLAPVAYTYTIGASVAVRVLFKDSITEVYFDDILIASTRDTRMWGGTCAGMFEVPASGITNFEINRESPDDDLTWNDPPFKVRRVHAMPIVVGGTRGLPGQFLNWQMIDTDGLPLTTAPDARYAWLCGRDHGNDPQNDVYLAWSNNLDLSDLSDFTPVINDTNFQVETPFPLEWTGTEFVVVFHSNKTPNQNTQSSVTYTSTDLRTWTNKTIFLEASEGEQNIRHTGYWQAKRMPSGQYRGISLGPNGNDSIPVVGDSALGYPGRPCRSAFRGWIISETAIGDIKTASIIGYPYWLHRDGKQLMLANNTHYFEHNSQQFCIGGYLSHPNTWNDEEGSNTVGFNKVSADLLTYSRRQDPLVLNPKPTEINLRGFGTVQDNNTLWIYAAAREYLGNPFTTGVSSVVALNVYQLDLGSNNFTQDPDNIILHDSFDRTGAIGGTQPDTVNNTGNSWVSNGSPGMEGNGTSAIRTTGSDSLTNTIAIDCGQNNNIRIAAKQSGYDSNSNDGFNIGIVFDYVSGSDYKLARFSGDGNNAGIHDVGGDGVLVNNTFNASNYSISWSWIDILEDRINYYINGILVATHSMDTSGFTNFVGVYHRRRFMRTRSFFVETI